MRFFVNYCHIRAVFTHILRNIPQFCRTFGRNFWRKIAAYFAFLAANFCKDYAVALLRGHVEKSAKMML